MANGSKLHVVMFPWLAFGHMIPFLELSKFIAQKGHKVTFISTPRNIDRLPKIPQELASSITLVKIPLPKIEQLPENAEATMDIPNEDIPHLKKVYDGLELDLTRFLESSLPDWIIYDFAPYWLPPIAAKLGISKAFFSIINAWFLAFLGPSDVMINNADPRLTVEDFIVPPKWVPFETKVAYKPPEINWILGAGRQNITGVSDSYRSGMLVKGSDVIAVRHCNEFEGQWLKLLEELQQKKVIPLGLIPPHLEKTSNDGNDSWVSIKEWLDSHQNNKGSVLYVALGSEVSLSQIDVTELALGLELSGVPFFWALRKPSWSNESTFEVPDGFVERVKGRGVVWKGWAPQVNILSHDSVGGFLTHCGWSSCIEGLVFGHPLVMLPFSVDQGLNARVMEDYKVGFEIPRNDNDRSYTRNSVAECVRLIMVENEGKIYREKAKEMSAIFGDRELHDDYVYKFIDYLENSRHNPMDKFSYH
ncbi:hypothetical protein ACH5RR_013343 [Cinchona calisaya]|uniref:Glycosyltransferase n=1 Tax=Cinchona calisaya TaxID=153742 RepID=A0ABD2ZZS6_9GENT